MRNLRTTAAICIGISAGATGATGAVPKDAQSARGVVASSAVTDTRGTEKSPLIVQTLPTSKSPEELKAEASDRSEKVENDRMIAKGTLLLAAFTAILAVGTVLLWLATRRLVKGAEDTARHQLRAYVHVGKITSTWDRSGNSLFTEAHIANSGQTPARDVMVILRCRLAPKGETPTFPELTSLPLGPYSSRFIIAAHQTVITHPPTNTLSEENSALVADEDADLFLYGRITYRDIFGSTHQTDYRAWYDPERGWGNSADGNHST